MNVKQGKMFTHRHWLDINRKPAVCKIFKVAKGVVYFDYADRDRAKLKHDVETFESANVREWL